MGRFTKIKIMGTISTDGKLISGKLRCIEIDTHHHVRKTVHNVDIVLNECKKLVQDILAEHKAKPDIEYVITENAGSTGNIYIMKESGVPYIDNIKKGVKIEKKSVKIEKKTNGGRIATYATSSRKTADGRDLTKRQLIFERIKEARRQRELKRQQNRYAEFYV